MKYLTDALSRMHAAGRAPLGDRLGSSVDAAKELAELHRVVAKLGADARCTTEESPATIALAKALWAESSGDLERLSSRHVRALCSDVGVATSPAFVEALAGNAEFPERRRWIEGLIASYFGGWRPTQAVALESLLQKVVKAFVGKSPRIALCKSVAEELFSPKAAKWLGSLVVSKRRPWEAVLEDWAVDRAGKLGAEAANASVDAWLSWFAAERGKWPASEGQTELNFLFKTVLAPEIITHEQLSKAISRVILWPSIENHEELVESVRAFVLKHPHLGDPRHRRSNWNECDPAAYTKVRAWFSRFDLEFFFKSVIREDPHKRKSFWLEYIDKVEMSNVALCAADALRLRARTPERLRYSQAEGTSTVSAFIMRFPGSSAILVEFSQPGNALYCHDAAKFDKYVRDGITQLKLHISHDLKHQLAMEWKVVHREGWQNEVRNLLATMGIRPQ
jgi:hypothetical protein